MSDLNISLQLLLALIPFVIIQFALMIFALIHLLKRKKTRNLNVIAWLLIIVLVNIFGPILYLVIGRTDVYGSD